MKTADHEVTKRRGRNILVDTGLGNLETERVVRYAETAFLIQILKED